MWSNQLSESFRFAVHRDDDPPDQWSLETPLTGFGMVDNHVDMKADDAGRVYAAIKTSADEHGGGFDAPLTVLLVRSPAGTWGQVTCGTLGENHSRPIVVIDASNDELYTFATKGMGIVYKKTSLDDIAFPPGPGLPFVSAAHVRLNDATNSKQPVTNESELLILANSTEDRHYYHAALDIRPSGTADPAVTDSRPTISLRASTTSTSAAGTSLKIERPAGVGPGDLLLASVDVSGGDEVSPPAGWQLVRIDGQSPAWRKATYYRLAGRSEPTSYSWQVAGHQGAVGLILSYDGVDSTIPIDDAAGSFHSGSAGLATAPSVMVSSQDAMLVGLFTLERSGELTSPPTMAERARVANSDPQSGVASLASDAACQSAGATSDRTATAEPNANGNGIGQLVVLRPAVEAAPGRDRPTAYTATRVFTNRATCDEPRRDHSRNCHHLPSFVSGGQLDSRSPDHCATGGSRGRRSAAGLRRHTRERGHHASGRMGVGTRLD